MASIRCPICDHLFESEFSPAMPFCSDRCRQIDLGRWLNEDYSVPAEPDPDEVVEPGWMDESEES